MDRIVETSKDDLLALSNILNEVCHGILIYNFERQIGFTYEEIYAILKKLRLIYQDEDIVFPTLVNFNSDEIIIFLNCFKEVFKQIEDWEFETRIGITIPEAVSIRDKIINE